MLDKEGKPARIIFRPTISLDKELDKLMEMGRASTKAGLLIDLLWTGIKAKREEMYGNNGEGMQSSNESSEKGIPKKRM